MSRDSAHLAWKKASASGESGCVELASLSEGGVALRDSKLGATSPILRFTRHEWVSFLDGLGKGEFEHLM